MGFSCKINIFDLLVDLGSPQNVLVYPVIETIEDPTEKNTSKVYLNPISIKAIVTEESFSSLKWKYYGQIPYGSVKILCELKWYNILINAGKIKIGDEYFKVYKDDSKGFGILRRTDYLVALLYKKELNEDA